jgi:hypothetical protein
MNKVGEGEVDSRVYRTGGVGEPPPPLTLWVAGDAYGFFAAGVPGEA